MAEMALVSSRKVRLKMLSDAGRTGAHIALVLFDNPGRFISTTQVGITLTGVLAGAYSGSRLAEPIGVYLAQHGLGDTMADEASITLVVIVITIATLIFGELVPKRLALKYPEAITCFMAWPMRLLSRAVSPAVWFLESASKGVLRIFGIKSENQAEVTEEEVKALIAEGAQAGVFEHEEQTLIEGVLRLADRPIRAVMTPRQDVIWIESREPFDAIIAKVKQSRHTRYIVCDGSIENPVGIVATRDILAALGGGMPALNEIMDHRPPALSPNLSILESLEIFRTTSANLAMVVDEYGSLEGVVSLKDVLMAIVGVLPQHKKTAPVIAALADGSYLLDGLLEVSRTEEVLGVQNMAEEGEDYVTLAGFILARLGEIPTPGQILEWGDYIFEIKQVENNRISTVLVKLREGSVVD